MTAQVLSTPMNTLRGILGSRDRDILGLDDDDSLVSLVGSAPRFSELAWLLFSEFTVA